MKEGVEEALRVADYWLGDNHLHHCLLYEVLSDYYLSLGSGEESINYMKESLSRCLRNTGPHSTHAAGKYYELGERELKAGRKREALDNFHKAKTNMESHQLKTLKYPQLLMRLAALHLNNGHLEHCNETAMSAVREFEEYESKSGGGPGATDTYKVKTFEVLSRAYEIGGRRQELKDLATLCAKKFNLCIHRSITTIPEAIRISSPKAALLSRWRSSCRRMRARKEVHCCPWLR